MDAYQRKLDAQIEKGDPYKLPDPSIALSKAANEKRLAEQKKLEAETL